MSIMRSCANLELDNGLFYVMILP
ncbi:uncharacterized protein FTOL_07297 [Fusarium torulosum]|uniref:Uncharacterized protein n=1 Tax=Fusarium torulosum TaxID=33205 RepID=A0AAE8SJ77_9HYPO|nr:uncharacterized protein FTOL_07297 [Fusarium torulosum]